MTQANQHDILRPNRSSNEWHMYEPQTKPLLYENANSLMKKGLTFFE